MNKFEAVLLLSPDISTATVKTEIDKFKQSIQSSDGKVINEEDWGLRDLSFTIKKYSKAFYTYFQIEFNSVNLNKMNSSFNQNDNILRHLFVKVNDHQELPTKLAYEKK